MLQNRISNDDVSFLKENYYWLDNSIVKAHGKNGQLYNVARLHYNKDSNFKFTIDNHKNVNSYIYDITVTFYKHTKKNPLPTEFETWLETAERLKLEIDELETQSLNLLTKYKNTDRIIIGTNSTGKDSMLVDYLAKKAELNFETYFNCTTLDVAESNKMAKKNNYNFTYPDKKLCGFYNWTKKNNIIPTRLNRGCCERFKENATIFSFDKNKKILFLFGMRNSESNARSGYEDIWVNRKWVGRDWLGLLPIREWTDLDVWLYTLREGIEINKKYRMGYARVGCAIACPNYGDSTWVLDEYWYNSMFWRWRKQLVEDFLNNYKWIIMNCTLDEYVKSVWNGGTFRDNPTTEVIQEFAEYKGIDLEVSKKYFQKYCVNGCRNCRNKLAPIKDKDVLAMNMKMFGRNIEKFMCKKCLMNELNLNEKEWNEKVKQFKESGCQLF